MTETCQPNMVSANALREAMRRCVSSVCIITAGIGNKRTGATITSATSLSVDPPTMIACINRDASVLPIIRDRRHFCINILAGVHQEVAERFAGRNGLKGEARYIGSQWETVATGASALKNALAAIDCELEQELAWHSHVIVFGGVRGLVVGDGSALVYGGGGYGVYENQ